MDMTFETQEDIVDLSKEIEFLLEVLKCYRPLARMSKTEEFLKELNKKKK